VHRILDALVARGAATEQELREWTSWVVGDAPTMVDGVVARARAARATEPVSWA
jgi:hypothetical protein